MWFPRTLCFHPPLTLRRPTGNRRTRRLGSVTGRLTGKVRCPRALKRRRGLWGPGRPRPRAADRRRCALSVRGGRSPGAEARPTPAEAALSPPLGAAPAGEAQAPGAGGGGGGRAACGHCGPAPAGRTVPPPPGPRRPRRPVPPSAPRRLLPGGALLPPRPFFLLPPLPVLILSPSPRAGTFPESFYFPPRLSEKEAPGSAAAKLFGLWSSRPPAAPPSDERPSGPAAAQPAAARGGGRAGPGVGAGARASPGSRRGPGRRHLVPSADRPEPRAGAAAAGLVRRLQPGARPRDGLLHRRPEGKAPRRSPPRRVAGPLAGRRRTNFRALAAQPGASLTGAP